MRTGGERERGGGSGRDRRGGRQRGSRSVAAAARRRIPGAGVRRGEEGAVGRPAGAAEWWRRSTTGCRGLPGLGDTSCRRRPFPSPSSSTPPPNWNRAGTRGLLVRAVGATATRATATATGPHPPPLFARAPPVDKRPGGRGGGVIATAGAFVAAKGRKEERRTGLDTAGGGSGWDGEGGGCLGRPIRPADLRGRTDGRAGGRAGGGWELERLGYPAGGLHAQRQQERQNWSMGEGGKRDPKPPAAQAAGGGPHPLATSGSRRRQQPAPVGAAGTGGGWRR